MRTNSSKSRLQRRGLTLVELVLSMTIIVIVFSALLPQFRVMGRSLELRKASVETLQSSRVFLEHIERTLSQASAVTRVTNSTNTRGYIEFTGPDGNGYRYDYSNGYIRFGRIGQQQIMAGPVSSLKFTCYALSNLSTPITTAASIKYIQIDAVFTDSTGYRQDQTATACIVLNKHDPTTTSITVSNYSFEQPGTGKITTWDARGANSIPGWTDNPAAADSGVEQGWLPTQGVWSGYLLNTDPSVFNLTSRVISAGDIYRLTVDVRDNFTNPGGTRLFQMTLYYGTTLNGTRTPMASRTITDLPEGFFGSTDSWRRYTLKVKADDVPASIGKRIGIELDNITTGATGWQGIDNVRLDVRR